MKHLRRTRGELASSLIPLQSVLSKRVEARIGQDGAVLPQKPGTAGGGLRLAPESLGAVL